MGERLHLWRPLDGEGLINAVRDEMPSKRRDEPPPPPPDRRLLLIEPEFARVIKVMRRPTDILSTVLRLAWETGDLYVKTRNDPLRATGAHISVIGHITGFDLLRHMDETDAVNGFGNRFLWFRVRASKLLPDGGHISERSCVP
jgi:hypothetical protein